MTKRRKAVSKSPATKRSSRPPGRLARRSNLLQHAVAAPTVPAADAADARPRRHRRGAEAEHPRRHELPVLRRGRNVVHGEAQAVRFRAPRSYLTMSNSPVVPTLHASRGGVVARGHGAQHRRGRSQHPISAFAHPRHFSFASRLALSLFLSLLSSYCAISSATPDEGMAERRQAPGCCEHPVARAMTGTRAPCFRRPAFSAKGNARLSALDRGDFAARACARRCPAFPPGSSADLVRRSGHRDPEDQVSRASRGGLQIRKPDLGTATGLAPHFKTPLENAPHEPG